MLEIHLTERDTDGKVTQREVVKHPGAAVILPMLDSKTVLLIRNRRYAIGETLIELPAGTLESGESPMNCAGRELVEETGYLAERLTPIGNFYPSPGVLTEKLYAFLAEGLFRSEANLDETEEIELLPTAYDEAIAMIDRGEIHDGKTIATLLMYDRRRRRGGN